MQMRDTMQQHIDQVIHILDVAKLCSSSNVATPV
jgi:hypothetical protein